MSNFQFHLSSDIAVGNYSLATVATKIAPYGKHFMLIIDPDAKETGAQDRIKESLSQKGISVFEFDGLQLSPDSDVIERTLNLARGGHVDGIIALGGITACSVARATAALLRSNESVYDFLDGTAPDCPPVPLIQIPSSCDDPFLFYELSPVVDARNRTVKLFKLQKDLCKLVVFDPGTYSHLSSNSLSSIVYSGVTFAFEGFISTKTNFFSETMLFKAMDLLLSTVNPTKEKLISHMKEELLAQASCLAGLGISSSAPGLGTAIALSICGRYNIAVPLVSTILLPSVIQASVASNLDKVASIAKMLDTEIAAESDLVGITEAGITELRRQLSAINFPTRLKDIGLTIESLVSVADDVVNLSFMSYLPRPMSRDDVFDFIKECF